MPTNKNNQGNQRPQQPQQPVRQPIHEQGEYNQRHSDRTTTTSQKPSPGPRE